MLSVAPLGAGVCQQAFTGQGQMKPEKAELAQLRREVIKLKAERYLEKTGGRLKRCGQHRLQDRRWRLNPYVFADGYCESFNGRTRDRLLNGELFYRLKEPRSPSNAGRLTTTPLVPVCSEFF